MKHSILTITIGISPCACSFSTDIEVDIPDRGSSGQSDETASLGATSSGDGDANSDVSTASSSGSSGSSESTTSSSGGSESTNDSGETTGGGCFTQPRPYGACDMACGAVACDGGRACIGDPASGEAACADSCESAVDCPSNVYPEPWATPVCQTAPTSGITGSWCGIACANDMCPNVTVCTGLGGTEPLCVGES